MGAKFSFKYVMYFCMVYSFAFYLVALFHPLKERLYFFVEWWFSLWNGSICFDTYRPFMEGLLCPGVMVVFPCGLIIFLC